MKIAKIIATAGILSIWLSAEFLSQNELPVRIITPPEGRSAVSAPSGHIVGEISPDITLIDLYTPYRSWKRIDAFGPVDKENFPISFRHIFPDTLVLESVTVQLFKVRGARDSVGFRFGIQEGFDLRKFWSSKEFREILAAVYDKYVMSTEVLLEGMTRSRLMVDSDEHRERFGPLFKFSVPLSPGENRFLLTSTDANNTIRSSDSITFFRTTPMLDAGADIPKTSFHDADNESACTACHALTFDAAALVEQGEVEDECSPCHQSLVTQYTAHYPAASWECLMCHDPSSDPKYQLYADKEYDATLCYECHTDKQELLDTATVPHAPAFSGECRICHDPHGSTTQTLLVDRVDRVCQSCHEDMVDTPHPVAGHPLRGRPDPRDPEKELSCASCHNPHASENGFLLPVARMQLCNTCHPR